ncbi:hypothetical protein FRC09_010876 [Ceratobasidium sp. 395]|nr:hypothetical protein FRC09_010876 [Ceratobasidium sp. 395]
MHEPTCTQTYVPFDLVVFTSFLILGYLWLVRLRPQPPRAVNGVVVETPRVAGLNPAVVGGHGVYVSSQSRRPSFVERQANREVVDEVAITPQTRHITSPRSPIAQGTRPEPTGHNDEAEPRNSRRSPTHSPTPSVHANTRGSTLGVVQPVVRGHGLTLVTDLPNTVELRGATVPTPGASGIPAIRSPVVQGIRRAAFTRIGRSGWRAPSPLSETERKKLVFSPHSYQYDHRLGAIDEVLDSAEQHQESMFYHTSQPSSPSTFSQLSTVGGKRNSTLIKALAGCDLSRAVAPLAILAVGVSAENLPGPDHDLEWISRTFSAVRFYALKGRLATEKGIRSALKHMFENAESVLTLVLYLTGHGNSGNVFELYGEQPLSEATLCRWIDEFRKTTGKHLPVLLVFDFCRQNISAPMVSTHELTDIYIIWACTPGERSYEVNLGDDLPYSDLLKVFCLTLHKMRAFPPQSPRCLMRKIATRVSHSAPFPGTSVSAPTALQASRVRTRGTPPKMIYQFKPPLLGFQGLGTTSRLIQRLTLYVQSFAM